MTSLPSFDSDPFLVDAERLTPRTDVGEEELRLSRVIAGMRTQMNGQAGRDYTPYRRPEDAGIDYTDQD